MNKAQDVVIRKQKRIIPTRSEDAKKEQSTKVTQNVQQRSRLQS